MGTMSRIDWSDAFSTGIPGIDHEHRELVDQLNALLELVDEDATRERIIADLGDVYGDISSHFALEEEMMRRHGYDQYREHAADHHRLLDEIQEITQRYEDATAVDTEAFKTRLADWFQVHFSTFDARLHREDFMVEGEAGDGISARIRERISGVPRGRS